MTLNVLTKITKILESFFIKKKLLKVKKYKIVILDNVNSDKIIKELSKFGINQKDIFILHDRWEVVYVNYLFYSLKYFYLGKIGYYLTILKK